jgi:hypothetical protein
MSESRIPEDYYTGPMFAVSLLRALSKDMSDDFLYNTTHVTGDYYIFEGEHFALDGPFEVVASGAVYCLGDLNEAQLIEVCKEGFGVDLNETTIQQD